jgi:hypothetical protein
MTKKQSKKHTKKKSEAQDPIAPGFVEEPGDEQARVQFMFTMRLAGVSADEAQSVLNDLHQRRGLTPANLVEEASDPEHPLHKLFEWRDDVAARKFREMQARVVIRAVGIKYTNNNGESHKVRAFVSIDHGSRRYLPTLNVLVNDEARATLLRRAAFEIEIWRSRYAHLVELADLVAAISTSTVLVQARAATRPVEPSPPPP